MFDKLLWNQNALSFISIFVEWYNKTDNIYSKAGCVSLCTVQVEYTGRL